jgi:hypothetical protein
MGMKLVSSDELKKHVGHYLICSLFTPRQEPAIYCDTCMELLYAPDERIDEPYQ